MRIYEFSKKYDKSNKEVVGALQAGGFDVKNHMSVVSDEGIVFLEKHFAVGKEAPSKGATSKKAPLKNKDAEPKEDKQVMQEVESTKEFQKVVLEEDKAASLVESSAGGDVKTIKAEPMLLGDLAVKMGVMPSQLIMFLLKQGVVCNINQMITKEMVIDIAEQFDIKAVESAGAKKEEKLEETIQGDKTRLPIVVVVGHVDHGKTTLLDYIRHTRVAAREKGGITQHVGAYRVDGDKGAVVFLDTPGHEAFTAIRKRGVKVADIAILMVAADDGIMPQTVEAINQAQEIDIPIVVAVNKIDKATDAQIEKIKTQLSQYGLTPEEWGGETIMVKISAKEGTNVDELIEMIALQAEMMDLKTNLDIPACGYIIEAKKEKGRGSVAMFIAQHGNLKAGDFFVCGDTTGKVVSLRDTSNKVVSGVGPSDPVSIAGFDGLPKAGDYLRVVPEAEYRKIKSSGANKSFGGVLQSEVANSDAKIKVLLKSDTASSDEAVVNAIRKLSKKSKENILVVGSEVGDVTEGDIGYADSVGADVYGFGVKISPSAAAVAKGLGVKVNQFGIIYKLVEHLEDVIEKGKVAEVIRKKTGSAIVRKVFNMKKIGVIAGVYVTDGKILKGAQAVVLRDGKEIGKGAVSSLQRDRKVMKEIASGYEGAFIIEGYTDWQEDDIVDCYVEEKQGKA